MVSALIAGIVLSAQGANAHCRVSIHVGEAPNFPVSPIQVALRFQMDDGWHIYWRNPGDAGAAPEVTWKLPPGWKASPLVWPKPKILTDSGITTFIFEREVILTAMIEPQGQTVGQAIMADVKWLVCQESCVPESASVKGFVQRKNSEETIAIFSRAELLAPKRLDSVLASHDSSGVTLRFNPKESASDWSFLPYDDDITDYSKPQKLTVDGSPVLFVPKSALFKQDRKRIQGALISNLSYYIFDVPLRIISGGKP